MKIKVVAEIGINHNGNLDLAIRLINMMKHAGCDAVKFQKRSPSKCYTPRELRKPCESIWGRTISDKVFGRELGHDAYVKINDHCRKIGMEWSASCWDMDSLLSMETFDLPWHKIASIMVLNERFVRNVAERRKLTVVSTGLLNWDGVVAVSRIFDAAQCPFIIAHCVARYPCEPERLDLRCIERMRREIEPKYDYCVGVGYSGHETGLSATVAAMALGATWIERHVTLDRTMHGSDHAASVEPQGMERLVKYARDLEVALGNGEKRLRGDEKRSISVGISDWL